MGVEISGVMINSSDKEVILTNMGLKQSPVKIPYGSKITFLDLSGNSVKDIPHNFINLHSIKLSRNQLTTVSDKLVQSLKTYPVLQKLDLSYNLLTKVPEDIFKLPQIRNVTLYHNKLTNVHCNSTTCQKIDLGNNEFSSCPVVANSVLVLSLDQNQIKDVKIFHNHLVTLSLKRNIITSFSDKCSLMNLINLDISMNNLQSLPNLQKSCPKLMSLDASHNKIKELPILPRGIFEIYLHHNEIENIEQLNNLSCLAYLDISFNKIKSIPKLPPLVRGIYAQNNNIEKVEYSHVPDLHKLYLMNNKITNCPCYKSNSLFDIYFNNNNLTSITFNIISTHTRYIDISHSLIDYLPDDLFNFKHLTHLVACNNCIYKLNPNIAKSHITMLNISFNPIEYLPKLPATIEELQISYCRIVDITESLIDLPDLTKLEACGNFISDFPFLFSLSHIKLSKNRLTVFPTFSPTLISLDVSFNAIENIPPEFTAPLLEFFDISYNLLQKPPNLKAMPSIRNCRCNNNPIKGEMQLGFRPIEWLDASCTELDRIVGTSVPQLFISSYTPGITGYQISPIAGTAIKQSRGEFSQYDDICIVKFIPKSDTTIIVFVDGRNSQKISLQFANVLIDYASHSRSPTDISSLRECLEHTVKKFGNRINASILAIRRGSTNAAAASIGDSPILVCQSNGNIKRVASRFDYSQYATRNRGTGQLGTPDPRLYDSVISERIDTKFIQLILVCSPAVADSIPLKALASASALITSAEPAVDRVHALARAGMSTDNISVIAIDSRRFHQYM